MRSSLVPQVETYNPAREVGQQKLVLVGVGGQTSTDGCRWQDQCCFAILGEWLISDDL